MPGRPPLAHVLKILNVRVGSNEEKLTLVPLKR